MPAEYRAIWSAPGGGTGYSVLHFANAGSSSPAQQIAADTRVFFNALNVVLPNNVIITFDSEVLDLALDGTLENVYAVTPPAQVTGLGTGEFARAAGAVVNWGTGVILSGRRLSGKTYIVPTAGNTFDTDGILTTAARGAIQTAAANFITATASNRALGVWSRARTGFAPVTQASVPIQGAILRGRRD